MGQNFNEFMGETKQINRWLVSTVFLTGMFAGACLMLIFALGGII